MSMSYIRRMYRVPARRGGRVVYESSAGDQFGTITGTYQQYLRIRLDDEQRSELYHPTWRIRYIEAKP